MLERWPGYNEQSWAQRFAELDRQFSKERDTAVRAICQLSSQTSARITALETALAEAEGWVETARNAALEEAAKVADRISQDWAAARARYVSVGNYGPYLGDKSGARDIAQAIRDMKDRT